MNIDKFGHHVHKHLRFSEYLDTLNNTLVKSETGDFDLNSSKLIGLPVPEKNDEAVNKLYVDQQVEELNKEIKKIGIDVKVYLKGLEKAVLERFALTYYNKSEIDRKIQIAQNKNEQTKHSQ